MPKLIFEAVDAGYGDCLIVRYPTKTDGRDDETIIVVDGGPSSAKRPGDDNYSPYRQRLAPRLAQLKQTEPHRAKNKLPIGLVVCTHIDSDHIAGIESLLGGVTGDVSPAPGAKDLQIARFWFNSYSRLAAAITSSLPNEGVEPTASHAMMSVADLAGTTADSFARAMTTAPFGAPTMTVASVREGERTTVYAAKDPLNLTLNINLPGGRAMVADKPFTRLGPATITIVAPHEEALKDLEEEWKAQVKKSKIKPGAGAKIAGLDDEDFGKQDDSVFNLSSIAMLVENDGRSVLLTGDARSDHVYSGLKKTGKLDARGKLKIDVMKVPHHGSKANVQPGMGLIENVAADHYVFSANGKDQNPDPPTVLFIAKQAAANGGATLWFTNGDMVYDPVKKTGKPPTIHDDRKGKDVPVKTLVDLIDILQGMDPAIKAKVTFAFRQPKDHSIVIPLD